MRWPPSRRRATWIRVRSVSDAGTFDYVIAGGGTAGCVLAARLSEDPDVTVCLVEAGPSDVGDANILPLSEWMHLLDSGYDWDYPVEPQERGNSFMRHARAKVLGGCSSHNSCIAFWPPAECLDEWVDMGAAGWSAAEILPLVKRLENNDAPGEHGHDGPVRLQDVPPNDPCGVAVLEAAALAGLPTVAFNRGETVRNGAGWFQINVGEDGTRMSTSHAYLHPILDTRRNLEVRTGCWVSEILFDEANKDSSRRFARPTATGVRYQRPDLTGYDTVSARREVIVTAGSIDTPKLLMLSGIGPTAHLREIGIPVRVDSPGVGSNLDDHVEGLVFWEASKPMVTTSTQWWEIGLFTTVDEPPDKRFAQPDLMMHYGSVPFDMNTLRRGYPTTDNGFCLTPNVTQGRSRGTVRLRSVDFRDRPKVDPRYFTDPEGYDERIMLTGVRLARTIAEQTPLKGWVARELAPGPDATTDDELLDYIHQTHNTVYHPAATARMGSLTDPMAVLDPQLRVKGVSRLRVVDASAMPKLPAVNPNITVMTMAEKCADLIRKG
jgi:choline oxidase